MSQVKTVLHEKFYRPTELSLLLLAVLISVVALSHSCESNRTATQALEVAREANRVTALPILPKLIVRFSSTTLEVGMWTMSGEKLTDIIDTAQSVRRGYGRESNYAQRFEQRVSPKEITPTDVLLATEIAITVINEGAECTLDAIGIASKGVEAKLVSCGEDAYYGIAINERPFDLDYAPLPEPQTFSRVWWKPHREQSKPSLPRRMQRYDVETIRVPAVCLYRALRVVDSPQNIRVIAVNGAGDVFPVESKEFDGFVKALVSVDEAHYQEWLKQNGNGSPSP